MKKEYLFFIVVLVIVSLILITKISPNNKLTCTIKNDGYISDLSFYEEIETTFIFSSDGDQLKKNIQKTINSGKYVQYLYNEDYLKQKCSDLEKDGATFCKYELISDEKVSYEYEKRTYNSDLLEVLNNNYGIDDFSYDNMKKIFNKEGIVCK